ncbi:3254_t:CDS:2 [Gigaspora margarita]|uniref:3254_t:CDS:1 n=1 Tax=Gigaspora margarita TaxID=4874 RepID=A0ABN7UQE9_GIGMA|nr:3254_t:CDS:2 [Gigaspora margarita]
MANNKRNLNDLISQNDDMEVEEDSLSDTSQQSEVNQQTKRRRTGSKSGRSFCWKYFEPYPETMGIETKCKFPGCTTKYTWRGSTSNLKGHLKKIHKIVETTKPVQKPNNNPALDINLPLIKFIVTSNQSFNVVNDMVSTGFVNKPYQIPATTLKIEEQINKTYDKLFSRLKQMIQSAESVALAIHIWDIDDKECFGKTFMEVTCHWLTNDFKIHRILLCMTEFNSSNSMADKYIEQIQEKWELTNYEFITTDFYAEAVFSEFSEFSNHKYIRNAFHFLESLLPTCLEQCLNVENQSILERIGEIKNKIDGIQDVIEILKEEEAQEKLSALPGGSIIFDIGKIIERKWSSIYFGLKYIVSMEQQINSLVSSWCSDKDDYVKSKGNDLKALLPDSLQFKILSKLSQIFEPLESVEGIMDNCDYLTINVMHSIFAKTVNGIKYRADNIKNKLESATGNNLEINIIRTITDSIYNFLNTPNYFDVFFYTDTAADVGNVASLLDPRFKLTYSSKKAEKFVQKECENFYSNQSKNTENSISGEKLPKRQNILVSDFFSDHGSANSTSNSNNMIDYNEANPQENSKEKASKELKSYLDLPQQQSSIDLYDWWKQYQGLYPGLAILARKYLAIPATAYSSKLSQSEHKENLKILLNTYKDSDIISKIVFLRHNKNYLDDLF